MFTGIIEELGIIKSKEMEMRSCILQIKAKKVLENTKIGDSIAVNGVCLTVRNKGSDFFEADIMHETLKRSSLDRLKSGDTVNLERALSLSDRLGGHIVTGHVDDIGYIKNITKDSNAIIYEIKADADILSNIVMKGSVTLDGISLTVSNVYANSFEVSTIPHTRDGTNLSYKKIGNTINIETDIIGKYIKKFMQNISEKEARKEDKKENTITLDFLMQNGF